MSKRLMAAMFMLMAAMGMYIIIDMVSIDTAETQAGITMPVQIQTQSPTIDDLQKRIVKLEQQVVDLQKQVADMNELKIFPVQ